MMGRSEEFLWDVFLSHSHRDRDRVLRLAELLRAGGLSVWLDGWVIQPGDDTFHAIEDGLERSRTLILCLSKTAIASDWVKLERNTVIFRDPLNKARRFIPVLLEDCQMPDTLRRYLHVDWRGGGEEAINQLIRSCKPSLEPGQGDAKRNKAAGWSTTAEVEEAPPSGAMKPGDLRYVKREADDEILAAALRASETIVIKAPRQMGKSSLLKRYLAECQANRKQTALLYLSDFQKDELDDYPTFLTEFARALWRKLGKPAQAEPSALRGQRELTDYIEDKLLPSTQDPIVFAFDEVDHVFGHSWQSDFFLTLRHWHDKRADTPSTGWDRLGLALVTSTEPYLFILDSMSSPFNVGS